MFLLSGVNRRTQTDRKAEMLKKLLRFSLTLNFSRVLPPFLRRAGDFNQFLEGCRLYLLVLSFFRRLKLYVYGGDSSTAGFPHRSPHISRALPAYS